MSKPLKLIITLTIAVSACMFLMIGASATFGIGTVNTNALKLREAPSTSSKQLDMAYRGDSVVVLDTIGDWCKVNYNYTEGYMFSQYIDISENASIEIGTGVVSGSVVNIRSGPSTSSPMLVQARKGEEANILGIESGWYKIEYRSITGYITSDYFKIQKTSLTSRGEAVSSNSNNNSDNSQTPTDAVASAKGSEIVEYAKKYLGVRYVYGGSTPNGFDCSGYTQYIMKHFGISINRTASDQLKNGTSVKKADLQLGDLVFFKSGTSRPASHVGIYVGNNSFIHATSPGDVVSVTSLSMSYYAKSYIGARRLIP